MQQKVDDTLAAIAKACARKGRDPKSVHLLAVSKFQPAAAIEQAYRCGLRDFGENYVQELVEKRAQLAHLPGIRWHLIGHLQSNKSKLAVANVDFFHALDSAKLARELAKRAAEIGRPTPLPVFIQVNVDLEESKSGVSATEVPALIETVRAESHLAFSGLMCIPRHEPDAEKMRPAFQRLAALAPRDASLSMGMSDDFEVAIEEGAHWVRVGRRLFGERLV